jgi:SAM-dependent methyltransferase
MQVPDGAPYYGPDVAYIHDAGHSDYALRSAPGLLRLLRNCRVKRGLVVDLGCGSGRTARELNLRGFDVLGIDASPALIRMARRAAPDSRFRVGSLWTADLPPCDAAISIGECVNYRGGRLRDLFARIHRALRPGGALIFDAATPARAPAGGPRRFWREESDWAVLVETVGRGATLTRRIVAFRRAGARYRRSEETHRLRLYDTAQVLAALAHAGFDARRLDSYGRFPLPVGVAGYLATR